MFHSQLLSTDLFTSFLVRLITLITIEHCNLVIRLPLMNHAHRNFNCVFRKRRKFLHSIHVYDSMTLTFNLKTDETVEQILTVNRLQIITTFFSLLLAVRQCWGLSCSFTTKPSRRIRNHNCKWHLFGEIKSGFITFLQFESLQAGIKTQNPEQVTTNFYSSPANSSTASAAFKHITRRYDERTVSERKWKCGRFNVVASHEVVRDCLWIRYWALSKVALQVVTGSFSKSLE